MGQAEPILTLDEAAERLRALLVDEGFDPERPSVELVWSAFKRFSLEPSSIQTTDFWFEVGEGDPDQNYPGFCDFVRMFMHYPEDGAEWGEQLTAHFTAPPTAQLGFHSGSVTAEDVADPSSWFEAVEASPSFKLGVVFPGWSFEIRIDGC